MKYQILKLTVYWVGFIFLTSCASQPVRYDQGKREGTWQGRVQVKDLKSGRSDVLSYEILSHRGEALRMELTGTLGVRVASLLVKGTQISYSVHTQKKYYSGNISQTSLSPLLKVPLDPRWLYNIFFDEKFLGDQWQCQIDAGGLVQDCKNNSGKYEVTWSERQNENKRVFIKGDGFEVNVLVKDFATKVEHPDKAFTLEPPASYKRYKLL